MAGIRRKNLCSLHFNFSILLDTSSTHGARCVQLHAHLLLNFRLACFQVLWYVVHVCSHITCTLLVFMVQRS